MTTLDFTGHDHFTLADVERAHQTAVTCGHRPAPIEALVTTEQMQGVVDELRRLTLREAPEDGYASVTWRSITFRVAA